MSIRYKFLVLFIVFALVPLGIVASLSYVASRDSLLQSAVANLEAIAELTRTRILETNQRYLDRVTFVSSNNNLQEALQTFNAEQTIAHAETIARTIETIKKQSTDIVHVYVYNPDNAFIASTVDAPLPPPAPFGVAESAFLGFSQDETDTVQALFEVVLEREGVLVGRVLVFASAQPILAITSDTTGLGETGEIAIGQSDNNGSVVFIAPLRFDANATLTRTVPQSQKTSPLVLAVGGYEGVLTTQTVDYRDKEVLAVTRAIRDLGWGLVVKIDAEEAFQPAEALRTSFVHIGLLVALFAGALALLLAFALTRPIKLLVESARSFQKGNFETRVSVKGRDEIGVLSGAFNNMAARLGELYHSLEEKVRERTRDMVRFKQAVESSTDAITIMTPDFKIVYCNNTWERLTGYTCAEIYSKPIDIFKGSTAPEELLKEMQVRLRAGDAFVTDDMVIRRKDGQEYDAQFAIYPVLDQGKTAFYVAVHQNIVERKKLERAKDDFVSLASHQLRTPLSAIRWYSELLNSGAAGDLSAEQKEYIGEIEKGNTRMLNLVTALLDVSKLELGNDTGQENEEDVDIEAVIEEAHSDVGVIAQKRGVAFSIETNEHVERIRANAKFVYMVVENVMRNAAKYADEHSTVTIRTEHLIPGALFGGRSSAVAGVGIGVTNKGIGIPKEQHDRVFEKMFRASNVLSIDTDGNGLGLYLVKMVVGRLGGDVWFESTPEKETTFYVFLPYVHSQKEDVAKT